MESYKVLVLGYHKSGKTTFIRNVNGQPTETANEYHVEFETNGYGPIRFVCAESLDNDTTNSWKYNGYIILCDLTNNRKYSHDCMKKTCKDLASMVGNRPIVLVGNKVDSTKKGAIKDIIDDKDLKRPFYEISARDKLNIQKPFLSLAKSLMKLPTLAFLDDPIPGHVDEHIVVHGENNIAQANVVSVPNPGDIPAGAAAEHNPLSSKISVKAASLAQPLIKVVDNVSESNVVNVAAVPNPGDIPVGAAAEHNVDSPLPSKTTLKAASSALPLDKKPTLRIRGNDDELDWDLEDMLRNQRPRCCYS